MKSDYRKAQDQYEFTRDIAESTFNEVARNIGMLVNQVAIVATYDSNTKKATVYFPSDLTTQSNPYYNLTGEALTVGQKVYVFYKYGDVEQGWIMAK